MELMELTAPPNLEWFIRVNGGRGYCAANSRMPVAPLTLTEKHISNFLEHSVAIRNRERALCLKGGKLFSLVCLYLALNDSIIG